MCSAYFANGCQAPLVTFFFFACLHRKHINICRNRSLKLLDKKKMKEKKKEDNSDDAPKTISQMVKERRKEKRK